MKRIETAAVRAHADTLFQRYPALAGQSGNIILAYEALAESYERGGKLLICGNGGSAADADHITGELMKGFYKKRPLAPEDQEKFGDLTEKLQGALPAIALTQHAALSTAFQNDVDPLMVFAQQVYGYGRRGDCLLAISTSGNAGNVCAAARVAKGAGLTVIALTGAAGGRLKECAHVAICVPETVTAYVQELHLPVYHTLCAMLEETFFAD